jgi:dTDP-glucose 4,6-dehydratase
VRVLLTGGAGFLGSHLCERLIASGHRVICYDSLLTGDLANLRGVMDHERFDFRRKDVTHFLDVEGPADWVLHFASPASPVDYARHPIHTLKLGALGTLNGLGLAKAKEAGFFLASTSEVYGSPQVHPQPESYWGHVNPVGPRSVYDEAKRFAEAMATAYHNVHGIPIRIARIFNTYGPRMRRSDGRAVPTFMAQALAGEPLTVHGDGSQTRSLCYVDDLVEGLVGLLEGADASEPVNLGNPHEVTVLEIAERIRDGVGSTSAIAFQERPVDDPDARCPDITRAESLLGWSPTVMLEEGLDRTIAWCRERWS